MAALGLYQDLQTDPRISRDIIKEMKLDDFETVFPPMGKFFKEVTSSPQPIKNLLIDIKQGLVDKHPAIVEFAEVALEKGWFSSSEHVYRSAHVTFILERIVAAMCNSHEFFIEVHNHLRTKERHYGLDSRNIFKACKKIFSTTHSVFGVLKTVTLDPCMVLFRMGRGLGRSQFNKKELRDLIKKHTLNYLEYKLLFPSYKQVWGQPVKLLELNIYEAGITDYKNGFKTNSISAFELNEDINNNPPSFEFNQTSVLPLNATDPFYNTIISKNNLFPTVSCSPKWVSLYITWNLAFITGSMQELDILFPKLFLPSIINVKSENFLGVRFISLWLSINTFFFRTCDGVKNVRGPEYKKEMAKTWARINKKYAFDLAQKETHEDSKQLMTHYRRMFSTPVYHFFRLLIAFLR